MALQSRPFSLGWHPVEPAPLGLSVLLDNPPSLPEGSNDSEYQHWRASVEADDERRQQLRLAQPFWRRVPLPSEVSILPVYGGTPEAIGRLTATLAMSTLESGAGRCRILNLSGWDLSGQLQSELRTAQHNAIRFDMLSDRGSTIPIFSNPQVSGFVALLVDTLRSSADADAGRRTGQDNEELERIISQLDPPLSLVRVTEAVDVALGATGSAGVLSAKEVGRLQDLNSRVVSQRRTTVDRLTNLHLDLLRLGRFDRYPGANGTVVGNGPVTVKWYEVAECETTANTELGRQLIAQALTQSYLNGNNPELLIVVGAERLTEETTSKLVDAAQRLKKRIVLSYTRFNDIGKRMLGYGGSSVALFLKMPHHEDARIAADFIGKEFTFMVNGVSISEGNTDEWSRTEGSSTSQGTSRTTSSSGSAGMQGAAFSFGHTFGSAVARSFERSTSRTTSTGGSISNSSTTNYGLVREHVVQPEEFGHMPDDLMMIVRDRKVTLASCNSILRYSSSVVKNELVFP